MSLDETVFKAYSFTICLKFFINSFLLMQTDISAVFAYVSAVKEDNEVETIKVERVLYIH